MSATFQPDSTPPARSTSGLKIVLIVIAVLGVLGLLVCGGFAALIYFGVNQAQGVLGDEFRQQLDGNPVIEQELGEIETVSMSIMETARRNEGNQGSPRMALNIEGTKADGVLMVETSADNRIVSATLETEDGRTVEVPIENTEAVDGADGADIDTGEPVEVEEQTEIEEQTEVDVDAPVEAEAP